MSDMLTPTLIIVVFASVVMIGISSCSHQAEFDRRQEMASLLRQDGYCAAIGDHDLTAPEQCQDSATKSRNERLRYEFGVR